ncbi:MAG: nucleoside permease [Verrucomicrobia bacterium]|nr:nucleoside permease [Verrucomicrobiota bacterium]
MNAFPTKLTRETRVRLSAMMFLQFFIWGAWFVTLSTYLGQGLKLQGDFIGRAYSTMPWGAIVAPFLVGMIADRLFPAEKVLGILHLLGAAALYAASSVAEPAALFWILLVYALCYNPTLALVNAVCFDQLDDPEKQFPGIRVFGTLGWIVAGLGIGLMKVEATSVPMKVAAGCSVLAGLLAFALPHTPPKLLGQKVTIKEVLGLDALRLMRERSFAVFVICSLLICIPLAFYYNFANLFLNERGVANAAGKMTMGQISELFFMLVMPFFFVRLGIKKVLFLGMLAWFVRYLLFAFGNPQGLVFMYYAGILMQGICFAFFFVTGQVYVNNTAPSTIRASAQGFLALITYGVGMLIGAEISGRVVQHYQMLAAQGAVDNLWKAVWLVPAGMAGAVIVVFAILFKDRPTRTSADRVEKGIVESEMGTGAIQP